MGWILASFRWGYALFQIPGGWLGDRIGPRRALDADRYMVELFHRGDGAFLECRIDADRRDFCSASGEAGAFPIATRSLSRWMLPSERGYAQGITHAGSRLGAALTPPMVVWLIVQLRVADRPSSLRRAGHRLGGRMVLVLSRHAARTPGSK